MPCHSERDGVSNHRHLNCFLNPLFRRRSKKTSKLCVTGLCEENPLMTGGFPSQRTSSVGNVFIWWRHHQVSLAINAQSLDTDVQRPIYSVAIVALLPSMGRERRWPRWIKKASHIGSKRLCINDSVTLMWRHSKWGIISREISRHF